MQIFKDQQRSLKDLHQGGGSLSSDVVRANQPCVPGINIGFVNKPLHLHHELILIVLCVYTMLSY